MAVACAEAAYSSPRGLRRKYSSRGCPPIRAALVNRRYAARVFLAFFITFSVSYLLTFTLPSRAGDDPTVAGSADPAAAAIDPAGAAASAGPASADSSPCPALSGITAMTRLEIDATIAEHPTVAVTDVLAVPANVTGLGDVLLRRPLRAACLPWPWTDVAVDVAEGEITARRASGPRPLSDTPVQGWDLHVRGRTLLLERSDSASDTYLPSVPWTLTVELIGTTWAERPEIETVPDSLDDQHGRWTLPSGEATWAGEIRLSRLAAVRLAIDEALGERVELAGPVFLGSGAPISLAFVLLVRRRSRFPDRFQPIVAAATALTVLYATILAVQWFAVDGVQTYPAERWWLIVLPLLLPPGALLAMDALDRRAAAPAIGAFVLCAVVCLAVYYVARGGDHRTARFQVAAAFTLVVAALVMAGLALAAAMTALRRPRDGVGPVSLLAGLAVGAGVIALVVAVASEWIETHDLVSNITYASPVKAAATKLLAFHPISTFVWPHLLTLLSLLVFVRTAIMNPAGESPAIPVPPKRWWSIALVFGFAVVGLGGRYLGLSIPLGLIFVVVLAAIAAVAVRQSPLELLLRRNGVTLFALLRDRQELILRNLELERLRLRRRSALRRGKEEGFSAADLLQDRIDLDGRIDLIARNGIGVPRQGLQLATADASTRLVFNGGTDRTWLANAAVAVRTGASLALVPLSYFVYVLVRDVPLQSGGVGTFAYLVQLVAEAAFWLAAAFTVGALSAWLPGSSHLTKGLGLAGIYAAVTGLAAVPAAWLGVDVWASWRFSVAQLTAYLGLLGLLLDHAVVARAGLTWREQIDLYRVGRVEALLKYAVPIAIAILSIGQQVISGDGSSVIGELLDRATSIIPSSP